MTFYFVYTNEDMIMTEEEKDYKLRNICRFCENYIECDKVREHCHLSGRYRGPAHNKCIVNATQKQSNFFPFLFHNFSNSDCQMFFKKLVDKKNDDVKIDIIPETNEEYISITYGCIRFIDSYRFLSCSLDSLVKTQFDYNHKTFKHLKKEIVDNDELLNIITKIGEEGKTIDDLKKDYPIGIEKLEEVLLNYIGENDLKLLKTEFPDKRKYLTKKLTYPYELFNSIDDYQKPVDNLKKEDFFKKLTKWLSWW